MQYIQVNVAGKENPLNGVQIPLVDGKMNVHIACAGFLTGVPTQDRQAYLDAKKKQLGELLKYTNAKRDDSVLQTIQKMDMDTNGVNLNLVDSYVIKGELLANLIPKAMKMNLLDKNKMPTNKEIAEALKSLETINVPPLPSFEAEQKEEPVSFETDPIARITSALAELKQRDEEYKKRKRCQDEEIERKRARSQELDAENIKLMEANSALNALNEELEESIKEKRARCEELEKTITAKRARFDEFMKEFIK